MTYYEIFANYYTGIHEDYEALAAIADSNMNAAKRMKKSAQIQRTQDTLTGQKKSLAKITSGGSKSGVKHD